MQQYVITSYPRSGSTMVQRGLEKLLGETAVNLDLGQTEFALGKTHTKTAQAWAHSEVKVFQVLRDWPDAFYSNVIYMRHRPEEPGKYARPAEWVELEEELTNCPDDCFVNEFVIAYPGRVRQEYDNWQRFNHVVIGGNVTRLKYELFSKSPQALAAILQNVVGGDAQAAQEAVDFNTMKRDSPSHQVRSGLVGEAQARLDDDVFNYLQSMKPSYDQSIYTTA